MGCPGLRGSFDGIGLSPKFRAHTAAQNGVPVTGFASAGAGQMLVLKRCSSGADGACSE